MRITLDAKKVGLWGLIDLTVDPQNMDVDERRILGWHRGRWLVDAGKGYDEVGEPLVVVAVPPEKVYSIFPHCETPFRLPEPWRANVRVGTRPVTDARVLAWDGEVWLTDAGPSDAVCDPSPVAEARYRGIDDGWAS